MWNLLLPVTNFAVFYPIITALLFEDVITAGIITFAATMSVVSHLFESHKHQMWGFGCPSNVSYLLNRLDVLAVVLVIGRMLLLWIASGIGLNIITEKPFRTILLLLAMACNILSEGDQGKKYYVPLHCVWHMMIFSLLGSYLESIYTVISLCDIKIMYYF